MECNGGHKEKRFAAFTFINVEGSTIVADERVTFTCKTGNFLGKDLVLDMDSVHRLQGHHRHQQCEDHHAGEHDDHRRHQHLLPNPAQPCINAAGAEITANPLRITASSGNGLLMGCAGTFSTTGGAFPTFNIKAGPPYTKNTKDTTMECNPSAGAIVCNANGCLQLTANRWRFLPLRLNP